MVGQFLCCVCFSFQANGAAGVRAWESMDREMVFRERELNANVCTTASLQAIYLVMRWGPLHLNQVGQLGIGEIDGWLEEEGENDPCWMKISNQAIYIGGKI